MPITAPDRLPSTGLPSTGLPSTTSTSAPEGRTAPSRPAKPEGPSAAASAPFEQVLRALGHEAERGERTVRGVLRGSAAGRDYGPSELLALQAGIYRYGETVDLAAKLVDKAGTDLRTVLQGQ
jgi:hypothetical protein